MRKTIDLDGTDWEFGSVAQKPFGDVNDIADVKDWAAALVPGRLVVAAWLSAGLDLTRTVDSGLAFPC